MILEIHNRPYLPVPGGYIYETDFPVPDHQSGHHAGAVGHAQRARRRQVSQRQRPECRHAAGVFADRRLRRFVHITADVQTDRQMVDRRAGHRRFRRRRATLAGGYRAPSGRACRHRHAGSGRL